MERPGNWQERSDRLGASELDEKGNHKYTVIGRKAEMDKLSKKLGDKLKDKGRI